MRYGSRVIVVRGPYADRRAVTVYSHDRRHVYVNLKSGAGIRVSRRDVRLARDQRVTPEEDRRLLRSYVGNRRVWPVRSRQ